MRLDAGPPTELTLRSISRFLPKAERKKLRRAAAAELNSLRGLLKQRRVIRKRLRRGLVQQELDLEALRADTDRLREIENQLRAVPQDLMFQVLPNLDQQSRERLARELFKRRRGPFRRGRPGPLPELPEGFDGTPPQGSIDDPMESDEESDNHPDKEPPTH